MEKGLPIQIKLPSSFYEEEIRNDFKVTEKTKELWAIQLDLLAKLDEVCKKYDIRYYADSGTLLGAIRHKGFIPWDDDIDVELFRDDYIRLCEVAEKEFTHPYFFQTEYTDPGSLRGHAQLRNSLTTGILTVEKGLGRQFNQGIFIDIFVTDYIPDDPTERETFFDTARELLYKAQRHEIKIRRYDPNESSKIQLYHKFTRLINAGKKDMPNEYYHEFEDYIIKNCAKPTKEHVKIVFNLAPTRKPFMTEWYKDVVEVPFETIKVPVPKMYDKALINFYGENWSVPILQTTAHGGMIIDTRKPYTEYL